MITAERLLGVLMRALEQTSQVREGWIRDMVRIGDRAELETYDGAGGRVKRFRIEVKEVEPE